MKLIINEIGNGDIYLKILKATCGDISSKDYSSMCDLMCHKAPYTPQLGFTDRIYIDIQDRGLDFKDEEKNFIQSDVLEYLVSDKNYFDVMICSDGIEHLSKGKGGELLRLMTLGSSLQIIFTPIGEYLVIKDSINNPDSHYSGWTPQEFEEMGWAVIEMPMFHEELNIGAFFAFNCYNIKQEFERIKNQLSWIK